jgi:hypothetical protein
MKSNYGYADQMQEYGRQPDRLQNIGFAPKGLMDAQTQEQIIGKPDNLDQIINEYVESYELRGDEGDYTPSEGELNLIKDAIIGLLADPDWDAAWGTHIKALSQPQRYLCDQADHGNGIPCSRCQALPSEPTGWQPIEKAPQKMAVDLWCKSKHCKDYGRRVTNVCLVGDAWYGSGLPNATFGEYASHWMALPKAPT